MHLRFSTANALTPLLLFSCLVVACTWLDGRLPATGWAWDFFNGLGLVALGGVVFLCWDPKSKHDAVVRRLHCDVAVVVAALVGAHIAGLLWWDPVVVEYLRLRAPLYMVAGIVAAVAIAGLSISFSPGLRQRLFPEYAGFRTVHTPLSIAALLLALWHVLGTDYYLSAWYEKAVFAALIAGPPLYGYRRRRRPRRTRDAESRPVSSANRQLAATGIAACLLAAAFAAMRNL